MASPCPQYTIRKATRADVPAFKTIAIEEGWEFDLNYLFCLFDIDDRAWFVAETETGEIIGVRALTYFSEQITTGGIYIVKPKYRGHGVGRDVNAAALGAIGASNIIISATDMNLYNTRGFIYDFDVHFKRIKVGDLTDALSTDQLSKQVTVKPYTDAMLSDVNKYDAFICKHERFEFVKNWIIPASEHVLVAYDETGKIVGYGCLRNTEYGYQIAPLYADSESTAWYMMKDLLRNVDRKVNVDLFINDKNEHVVNLLQSIPLEDVVTLYKMYKGKHFEMALGNVYALTFVGMTAL